MLKHSMFSISLTIRLPKNKPIRKLNLYLGFTPVKRANPIGSITIYLPAKSNMFAVMRRRAGAWRK